MKYKYMVIVEKDGKKELEPWTGVFDTKKLADEWYEKHSDFHKQRGHELVLVITNSKNEDE